MGAGLGEGFLEVPWGACLLVANFAALDVEVTRRVDSLCFS